MNHLATRRTKCFGLLHISCRAEMLKYIGREWLALASFAAGKSKRVFESLISKRELKTGPIVQTQ